MTLKELRKSKGITQQEAANYAEMPLRTYINYENDILKQSSIKYKYLMEKIQSYGYVDEEHGILTIEDIRKNCISVLRNYSIEYCYLFGSYAKGKATASSDVDLLICTDVTGLKFYGLIEELRTSLKKKVDLLNQNQLENNFVLVNEILKDGIKIYE